MSSKTFLFHLSSPLRGWFFAVVCVTIGLICACTAPTSLHPTTASQSSTPLPPLGERQTPQPDQVQLSETLAASTTDVATPALNNEIAELVPITYIQLASPHFAWGLDYQQRHLYRSEDSGSSWKEVTPTDSTNQAYSFFLDAFEAWFLVSEAENTSRLFHTLNGAQTWDLIDLNFSGGRMQFSRLAGSKEATGVILSDLGAGAGSNWVAIYVTKDGGKHWEQTFTHSSEDSVPSLPAGGIKTSITYDGMKDLWITGSVPIDNFLYLYHSTDLGVTWEPQSCEMQPIADSAMVDAIQPIWVSKDEGILPVRAFEVSTELKTVFCQTKDHGKSWQFLSVMEETSQQLFIQDGFGWVTDGSRLWRTRDGGFQWEKLSGYLPVGETIVSFHFSSSDIGVLVTNPSNFEKPNENKLYLSMNGGLNWNLLPTRLMR